jgi:hypothetical protein
MDSPDLTRQAQHSAMHPPVVPLDEGLSGARPRTVGKSNKAKASGQKNGKGSGFANATTRVTVGPSNSRSGRLPKFVTHDQNNLMDDAYVKGMTPFDNSGEFPQWKVDAMQSKKKGLKRAEREEQEAASSLK